MTASMAWRTAAIWASERSTGRLMDVAPRSSSTRAAQCEHGGDVLVGEQHDAAALADAMDADLVLGRCRHDRFQGPRPFHGRDLDPILAAVGEPLGGVGQAVGVRFRKAAGSQDRSRAAHGEAPRYVANRALSPPSTARAAPVMAEASSEATKATRLATSRGVDRRPNGCTASTRRSASAGSGCIRNHSSTRRVRVHPGSTALTRMPAGAQSRARLRVRPTRPALAAAYGNIPAMVSVAWMEAMFTMEPRPARFIAGSAC